MLVTTDPEARLTNDADYVYVDWGPDFLLHHGASMPEAAPGLSVNLGPLALSYVLAAGGAGYFRMRAVEPCIASGQLHLVPGMPQFSYPVYAVHSPARTTPFWVRRWRGCGPSRPRRHATSPDGSILRRVGQRARGPDAGRAGHMRRLDPMPAHDVEYRLAGCHQVVGAMIRRWHRHHTASAHMIAHGMASPSSRN